MKKILILFLIPQLIFAELILEITKGSDDPFVIALLSFDGKKVLTSEVDAIINNDLKRTGEFKIIKDEKLLSSPNNEEEINFNDFKLLGIDYIVMGLLESEDKFNLSASYEIYNVASKKKIRTTTIKNGII